MFFFDKAKTPQLLKAVEQFKDHSFSAEDFVNAMHRDLKLTDSVALMKTGQVGVGVSKDINYALCFEDGAN